MKKRRIIDFSLNHPKVIVFAMLLITFSALLFIPKIKVDTDPENMLSPKEAVRVFHNKMKKEFSLYDMLVLGIVNEKDSNGVFNVDSLGKIYELAEYAKTLQWDKGGKRVGVIDVDLLAPSNVDNMEQAGLGVVKFNWLMPSPPKTEEEALKIRDNAMRISFLRGTLVSEDGKALCLYLPLSSKDISYDISEKLKEKIAEFKGDERYFITGLPVAEDTFGTEMFKQMAISAPLAMVIIFLLMFYFFRKLVLIISPMILALCSVIFTMGFLIATGNTVHIMSSMIPIFIMPIAVLDSIHILSEFFELYQHSKDRKQAMREVMDELFAPMLYTSLTSAAGFASLALTPIPPVQTFGIFVAIGVMYAWFLTITFIPAYVALLPAKAFENFGAFHTDGGVSGGRLGKFLSFVADFTYNRAKLIIFFTVILGMIAAYGISLININDNPTRWFTKDHPIRLADRVLNEHFGGTYMGYLVIEADEGGISVEKYIEKFLDDFDKFADESGVISNKVKSEFYNAVNSLKSVKDKKQFYGKLSEILDNVSPESDDEYDMWDEISFFVDSQRQKGEYFKEPEVLKYVERLEDALLDTKYVGKSNSIVDIVKTVHRELLLGKDEEFRIPDSKNAVSQTLLTYQNSHRPNDLWHFVTPDYKKISIWVQLKTGDNRDMSYVIDAVDKFMRENKPPIKLKHRWFGLTYINVIWQKKMVSGMLQAFIGSFLVVFIMMTYLFRSALWGGMCMIPLSVTIAFIYGGVGFIGKDYDMPIAVLSSLTLGLAVDFAIHFLSRARMIYRENLSWEKSYKAVFGEPARAIARNIIVIAVGFLPLLAAPLVPYKTVGIFLATILAISGAATLLILPALNRIFEKTLFKVREWDIPANCKSGTCFVLIFSFAAVIAVNLHQYADMSWAKLQWLGWGALFLSPVICALSRKICKMNRE